MIVTSENVSLSVTDENLESYWYACLGHLRAEYRALKSQGNAEALGEPLLSALEGLEVGPRPPIAVAVAISEAYAQTEPGRLSALPFRLGRELARLEAAVTLAAD